MTARYQFDVEYPTGKNNRLGRSSKENSRAFLPEGDVVAATVRPGGTGWERYRTKCTWTRGLKTHLKEKEVTDMSQTDMDYQHQIELKRM